MANNPVTVINVIAQIRSEADIEEPEAGSIATDAQLLVWLNKAWRELIDLLADEVGFEYFAVQASVGPSSWAVPDDFYRALGIDVTVGTGVLRPALMWNFSERNDNDGLSGTTPYFRIINGVITWRPTASAPTSAVTLWYIPLPADLASNGSFNAFNGWDDYVVKRVVLEVKRKQEYDTSDTERMLLRAENLVRKNAQRIRGNTVTTVADAVKNSPYWYYNG